ncbi:MAG: hypothetical protein AB7H43_09765 [Acidimicrobiia bacterium]
MIDGTAGPPGAPVAPTLRRRPRWILPGRYWLTLVVALGFYGYAWMVQPYRPQLAAVLDEPPPLVTVTEDGIRPEDTADPLAAYQARRWGYLGAWYDQFHYARMARALGRFELPGRHWDHERMVADVDAPEREPSSFSYGLGYPLVGAAFFLLGFRGDPFVVADGLLFALAACLALALAERVLRPRTAVVAVNALVLTAPLVTYFVIPYGSSLTAVAVLGCLLVVTGDRFDWRTGLAVGTAVALAFAARYVDVVWLLGVLVPPLLLRWRAAWRVLAATTALLVVTAALVGLAQDAVFGHPLRTPYRYVHGGLDASLDAYRIDQIPEAAVGVVLTGDRSRLFRVEPILRGFPWAVLAPVGLAVLFRRRHRLRWALALGAAVGVASSLLYFAWAFGNTRDLSFWIIRFHAPWFALWAVLAAVAVEAGLDRLVRAPLGGEPASPA